MRQTFKTWLGRGGWLVVLILVYYVLGYGPFVSWGWPGAFFVAFYFHWAAFLLFWLVVVGFVPIGVLLLLLKALFRRRIRWSVIGWCIGYMVAIATVFCPVGGYGFEAGPSLEVQPWGKSYHVSLFTFDDDGLLRLYECGPLKLLCRRVYEDCNNFGPRFDERMTLQWANNQLSFYNRSTLYYQRTQDEVLFDFLAAYKFSDRPPCRYSFWTP